MNRDETYYGDCAVAKIYGSPEYPKLSGTVCFEQLEAGVLVTAEILNLPYDDLKEFDIFAFHIHEGSHCAGNTKDPFAETGGHLNPNSVSHPLHAGDMPPLFGNRGYAFMSFFTDRFSVKDVIGRTVIIHSGVDDFTSQPSGNSGSKIACGEIKAESRADSR